jgi:hypothetical protein
VLTKPICQTDEQATGTSQRLFLRVVFWLFSLNQEMQ